jgi:hypothetical protein
MKHLITFALALLCGAAFATGKPPAPGANASSTSAATSTASPAANSYGSNSGDAWAVALPGHGSPSYAGQFSICVRGRGVLWNAFWSWEPDTECVKLIAELTRLAATPVPKPTMYPMAGNSGFSPSDEAAKADAVTCDQASEKLVRTAAAKNGKPKAQKVATVAVGGCGK